jgi:amidase
MQVDVAWAPAEELARDVRDGRLDPQLAASCHLDRISRHDGRVGAYIHVDPSACAGPGPLSGVTVAVKDSYPVRGMPWTFGSRKWRDRVATQDAVPVRRLRDAGAAVLGKTNLPELAAAVGTVNESFPPTHNPWRHGFTPGGSSGGSAAAVAAGLCTVALGDDMGGSVRIPAACCGVVGLRPEPGRVPEEVPDPTRLSVRGPLARRVSDIRLLMSVMAERSTGGQRPTPATPRRLRLAVVRDTPFPVAAACGEAAERAAGALQAAGHRLTTASWDPLPVLESYLVVRPASVSVLPGEPGEYGASSGRLIARGRQISAREYLTALGAGLAAADHLHDLLRDCDAILTPALGRQPMPIAEVPPFLSDAWLSYIQFMVPVSYAGLPAVSVPAGSNDGLPLSVQLVGRPGGEAALLDLAEQLEASPGFGFRRPPGWD